jgi:hypothetical protein
MSGLALGRFAMQAPRIARDAECPLSDPTDAATATDASADRYDPA